jgi:hypothetical protein
MYKWNIKDSRFSIQAIDKDLPASNFIEVSAEEYTTLSSKVAEGGYELFVDNGVLTYRESNKSYSPEFYEIQDKAVESKRFLESSDWKVIRELERMYLKDTDLGKARDAARLNVVHQDIPVKE